MPQPTLSSRVAAADEQSVGRTNRTVLDLLRALNGRQLVLLGSSTEAHVAQATMCALASHGREDAIGQFKRWGWANLLISTRFWPPTRKRAISPKHEGCATYGAFDATHRDLVSHRRRYVFSALSPCYDVDRFEREVLDGGADVVVVAYHPDHYSTSGTLSPHTGELVGASLWKDELRLIGKLTAP
eukprot:CAMPEP_0181255748 /NCGR_PEP_ID=MMETSP1096-20121128/49332_1 /TAXON_ID=156174 ORGANISM="Chrysochromulina ericina, Strain CCMP281" /NCGR_SAMPLE_ID=MMETSP1096 /ASSEMBLY_ACC=CAM_ASM_000453 /LENGTH=185 /DNA_ID=CAMNT_0023353931 /DNA_START=30 /DNA_END=588 /DNA_ORIENTATION=-